MTSLNFSTVKDVQKNIALFDDKIFAAKTEIESQREECLLQEIKQQGLLSFSMLETKDSDWFKDIKPKRTVDKTLEPRVSRFMDFLNNKVRMHGL